MADYSITAVTRRVVYTGSAGVGPYSFSFPVLASTDLAVYKNATKLTLTTHYTVTINAATGTGSITLVSAAISTDRITIIGSRAIERTTDFVTAGDFKASSVNEQLDSQIIMIQQLAEENKRTLKAPQFDPAAVEDGGTVNMVLPVAASRAGKTLAFDSSGNPVVGEEIGNWRGNWAAGTSYTVRDLVADSSNYNVYRVNTAHTSTGALPISTNVDAAKWDLVIDSVSAGAAAAVGAGSLAVANNLSELTATASTARTNLGLGSISTQAASSVAITGGAVNGTTVGASTPSTGAFTTLSASGTATFSGTMSATANAYMQIDALTDAATIAVDMSVGNNFSVTLAGNRTLGNPTNLNAGQSGVIFITQDGTGSRTLAYSSYWDFPAATAPTLTTTANAVDVIVYTVRSSTSIAAQAILNIG